MAERRRLLIATGSRHKFGELRDLLELHDTDLVSLTDLGLSDDAVEKGATFYFTLPEPTATA